MHSGKVATRELRELRGAFEVVRDNIKAILEHIDNRLGHLKTPREKHEQIIRKLDHEVAVHHEKNKLG